MFNYADDNTLFYASQNIDDLKKIITQDTTLAVNWFTNNGMQANPGKFQLLVSHRTMKPNVSMTILDIIIESADVVNLLGVNFDI